MDYIIGRLSETGFGEIIPPTEVQSDALLKIHDAGYLSFLKSAWDDWKLAGFKGEAVPTVWQSRSMPSPHIPDFIEGKIGYYCLAAETSISNGTAEAAWASLDVALSGAERILASDYSAFSLCRPPGHHASHDQFGGYCFINNAAVAAQHMRDKGLERVAVLDVDFHHGNGTQAIFYNRSDVLFLSLHGDPMAAFPHFLGHKDEIGLATGRVSILIFRCQLELIFLSGVMRWTQRCIRYQNLVLMQLSFRLVLIHLNVIRSAFSN
jgi:acetoin utilization deacetylase AcuC-like enzyme